MLWVAVSDLFHSQLIARAGQSCCLIFSIQLSLLEFLPKQTLKHGSVFDLIW